ncbi:MAG: alpha/beta hydrolase fold domain-containing protein [Marivibrio sp.]|uniref:alpha/beta hydrolase family protein n=1 Tax=Marivibrio sp. TaxID=2039719 RepID=UPI0032EB79E7
MLSAAARMRARALARRIARLVGSEPSPPTRPGDPALYDPSGRTRALMSEAPLKLARALCGDRSLADWQAEAREKLAALTGFESGRPHRPPVIHDAPYVGPEGYRLREVVLRSASAQALPMMLVSSEQTSESADARRRPVILTLQGSNSGFHLSWGEKREPVDEVRIANGGAYALQAADLGFLAVALEMRCFGRRRERALPGRSPDPCIDQALHLMLTGRSLLGERATEVATAVDWLRSEADGLGVDPDRIYIMGQSAGGSVALYTTALDERIAGALIAGSLGFVRETFGARGDRSGQNVTPGLLQWMETDDVLALCAPRPVLALSGRADHIYPCAGVERVVASARSAWDSVGAADRLRALGPDGPHRFYPEAAWPAFVDLIGSAERAS